MPQSQGWISISSFSPEGEYLNSDEIYQALTAYIIDYLSTDAGFSKSCCIVYASE